MLSPLSRVQVQAAARQSRADGDDKGLGGPGKWPAAGKVARNACRNVLEHAHAGGMAGISQCLVSMLPMVPLPSLLKQASRASVHTSLCLAALQSAVSHFVLATQCFSLEAAEPQLGAPFPLNADVKRIKTENGYAGLKEEPFGVKTEALGVKAEPAGVKAEPGASAEAAHEELAWEDVKEDEQQQQQQVPPAQEVAMEEHDDEADWEDI